MNNNKEQDINSPEDYKTLTPEEQTTVADWIDENIQPFCGKDKCNLSSYILKDMMRVQTGLYLTNGQFKGAMLLAGYQRESGETNWTFRIALCRRSKIPSKITHISCIKQLPPKVS